MNLNQLVKRKAERYVEVTLAAKAAEQAREREVEAIRRFERDAMRIKAMVKCHAILAADLHNQQGGSTTRVGENGEVVKGYAVSAFKELETVLPYARLDGVGRAKLEEFITRNIVRLSEPGYCLGTWANEGKTYLDVVIVTETPDEAERVARANNQLAYYNLAQGVEISVS